MRQITILSSLVQYHNAQKQFAETNYIWDYSSVLFVDVVDAGNMVASLLEENLAKRSRPRIGSAVGLEPEGGSRVAFASGLQGNRGRLLLCCRNGPRANAARLLQQLRRQSPKHGDATIAQEVGRFIYRVIKIDKNIKIALPSSMVWFFQFPTFQPHATVLRSDSWLSPPNISGASRPGGKISLNCGTPLASNSRIPGAVARHCPNETGHRRTLFTRRYALRSQCIPTVQHWLAG